MDNSTDPHLQREKTLNLLRWVDLGGGLVIGSLFILLLSDLGILAYALAAFIVGNGLVGFFVLFPWLIKRGQKKSN